MTVFTNVPKIVYFTSFMGMCCYYELLCVCESFRKMNVSNDFSCGHYALI